MKNNFAVIILLSTMSILVIATSLNSVYAKENIKDVKEHKFFAIQHGNSVLDSYSVDTINPILFLDKHNKNIQQYLRFEQIELPGNFRDGIERDNILNNKPQFSQNDKKFRIGDNNIDIRKNNDNDNKISQIQKDNNKVIIGGGDNNQIQKDNNKVIIGGGDNNQIQKDNNKVIIGGGDNNQIQKDNNKVIIGGGDNNQIQKDNNKVIIGGGDNN